MAGLNRVQRLILQCVPFRANLFLQTKYWKNSIYFGGLNEDQQKILIRKYFELNPPPEPFDYGPPFEPPWKVFPEYPMYSMGFRMGSGEDYMMQFRKWYLTAADDDLDEFKETYPEKKSYSGFYESFDKAR